MTIHGITSTCGCAAATPNQRIVKSGEDVEIDASLHLSRTGRRVEAIYLNLGSDGQVELHIGATGRSLRKLVIFPLSILINDSGHIDVTLMMTQHDSDSAPSDPALTLPDGFDVAFGGWGCIQSRDDARGEPARWEGSLVLSWNIKSPDFPKHHSVLVMVGNAQSQLLLQRE